MMKYAWLPALILLGAAGCHSDAYYQEQAVESARKFIFKHARELTPEQYSVVKFDPPVILNGSVFTPVGSTKVKKTVMGEEKRQICITWRIPGADYDYLVYGVSEPRMAYWKPLRLIRRRVIPAPPGPVTALADARRYAVTALDGQLNFADLDTVRFTHPTVLLTAFPLQEMQDGDKTAEETADWSERESSGPSARRKGPQKNSADEGFISGGIPPVKSPVKVTSPEHPVPTEAGVPFPRPWRQITIPQAGRDGLVQLSLVWKISGKRYVVFCGVGKEDLSPWTICQAGIVSSSELADNTVKELKSPEKFLFKTWKNEGEENLDEIVTPTQPQSESPAADAKESADAGGAAGAGTAPVRKNFGPLPKENGTGEKNGKGRGRGYDPGKGV